MALYLIVFLLLPLTDAVLEQVRDSNNVIAWKTGPYRNRNVIPMPTGLDLEKKHRRDTDGDPEEDKDSKVKKEALPKYVEEKEDGHQDVPNRSQKKSFIREHFSLPVGAEIPLGYNNRVQRKGKKSEISNVPLADKLTDNSYNQFSHGFMNGLVSRSKVPKTWGMTWKDPHPNPVLYKDTSGYERSTLAGRGVEIKKNGKISEQEFDWRIKRAYGKWYEEDEVTDYPVDPPPNATLNVEFDPMYGSDLDYEYDQQYPFQVGMNPLQEQNHDYHHNSINKLVHAPYVMHDPHGDYQSVHPGHPYEGPMEDMVTGHVSLDDDEEDKGNSTTDKETKNIVVNGNSTVDTNIMDQQSTQVVNLVESVNASSGVWNMRNDTKSSPEVLHLMDGPTIYNGTKATELSKFNEDTKIQQTSNEKVSTASKFSQESVVGIDGKALGISQKDNENRVQYTPGINMDNNVGAVTKLKNETYKANSTNKLPEGFNLNGQNNIAEGTNMTHDFYEAPGVGNSTNALEPSIENKLPQLSNIRKESSVMETLNMNKVQGISSANEEGKSVAIANNEQKDPTGSNRGSETTLSEIINTTDGKIAPSITAASPNIQTNNFNVTGVSNENSTHGTPSNIPNNKRYIIPGHHSNADRDRVTSYRKASLIKRPQIIHMLKNFSHKIAKLGQRNDNGNLSPAEIIL